jgi:hypothetical protein
MSAVARLAESVSVPTVITFEPSKWFFGGVALIVLLALVVVVNLFNVDR